MVMQHARHLLRQLSRNPGFAFVTIGLLALGIGAATAVFGLVRGVLLRPLPFGDASHLAVIWEDLVRDGNHTYSVTPATYRDIRDQAKSFEEVAAQQTGGGFTIRDDHSAEVIRAGLVTGNFFKTVHAAAALGRTLSPQDDEGNTHVVVLSDALWRKRFGADHNVIGTKVLLDDTAYSVVGVMGPEFDSPWVFKASHLAAALWTPLTGVSPDDRQSAMLQVIARLRPGVTTGAARAEMSALATSLAHSYPATNTDVGLNLVPMREQFTGRVRTPLLLLLGSILLLLLIAASNLASLLLQRALGRRHEMAIRVAIGASRARIVAQIVTENAMLAFIGGACGVAAGSFGLRVLVALAPADTPRLAGIHADRAVCAFAVAVTFVVGILLGFAPALRASNDISGALRGGRMKQREITRGLLAFVQVTLAVTLLIAGALFTRSFARLTALQPGFAMHDVLTLRVMLPSAKYDSPQRQSNVIEAIISAADAVPGVISAGMTSRHPLDPPFGYSKVNIEGHADEPGAPLVGFRVTTPAYLETLRVPLTQGRYIATTDAANSAPVAIVNAAFARHFFPGTDARGKRISFGNGSVAWAEIVGVVGDMNNGGLDADPIPEVFVPLAQSPIPGGTLVIRTTGDPRLLANSIQAAIAHVDPTIATQDPLAMDDIASATIALPRFSAFIVATFGILALLLATLGVYAIFAQAVTAQRRELGIRAALGAPARLLLVPVLQEGMTIALGGIIAGSMCAFALSSVLQSQLFGVAATDAMTYAAVAIAVLLITAAACLLPGRRVLKTNPAVVLRAD